LQKKKKKKKRKKKDRDKKGKKKEERNLVFNYHTPSHEQPNIFSTLIVDRETIDMIIIIRSHISSN